MIRQSLIWLKDYYSGPRLLQRGMTMGHTYMQMQIQRYRKGVRVASQLLLPPEASARVVNWPARGVWGYLLDKLIFWMLRGSFWEHFSILVISCYHSAHRKIITCSSITSDKKYARTYWLMMHSFVIIHIINL